MSPTSAYLVRSTVGHRSLRHRCLGNVSGMSQGGYRDERDEWLDSLRPQSPSATRRPRHGVSDEPYDSDDPVPAYRTRPTDHFVPASEPGESGSAYGGPWYGRRPSGSPYGNRPEAPQQRYPDAYVA